MREKEMRQPVADWLASQRYRAVVEMVTAHIADMIGVRYAPSVERRRPEALETIAVELKLSDVAGVLRQCERNKCAVETSWAAMPEAAVAKMLARTLDKFRNAGVGLLSVGSEVRIIVEAVVSDQVLPWKAARLKKNHWRRLRKGDTRIVVSPLPFDEPEPLPRQLELTEA